MDKVCANFKTFIKRNKIYFIVFKNKKIFLLIDFSFPLLINIFYYSSIPLFNVSFNIHNIYLIENKIN